MTNHTDTSRIADLRFQVSEKMPINHSDLSCLFDRIEALEAENEWLREELAEAYVKLSGKSVHTSDCATSNSPAMKPGPCDCAALGEKQ